MVRALSPLALLVAVPAAATPAVDARDVALDVAEDDDETLVAALPDTARLPGGADDAIRFAQSAGEGSMGRSTDDGSTGNGKFKMTYIGFQNLADGSRIFARMNDAGAKYAVKKEGQNLLVLEISDAYIPLRNNKNHLDTTFFESPVKMITPGEVEGTPTTIRIVVEMKEDVPYEEKVEGRDIVIFVKK